MSQGEPEPDAEPSILGTVPPTEAFLFYTDIGQYTGKSASSILDFLGKLNEVPLKSVEFHFSRGDFEKWVRETLGDMYLADRLREIERSTHGEELRKNIQEVVERHLRRRRARKIARRKS